MKLIYKFNHLISKLLFVAQNIKISATTKIHLDILIFSYVSCSFAIKLNIPECKIVLFRGAFSCFIAKEGVLVRFAKNQELLGA